MDYMADGRERDTTAICVHLCVKRSSSVETSIGLLIKAEKLKHVRYDKALNGRCRVRVVQLAEAEQVRVDSTENANPFNWKTYVPYRPDSESVDDHTTVHHSNGAY